MNLHADRRTALVTLLKRPADIEIKRLHVAGHANLVMDVKIPLRKQTATATATWRASG